jgi:hypothetical protein
MIAADRSKIESIIASLSDSIRSISRGYKISIKKSDCDQKSGKSDCLSDLSNYIFRHEVILVKSDEN